MELKILTINALVYTIVALYIYCKNRKVNTALFITVYYAICAWGAVAYYTHPLFTLMRGRAHYEYEPFLYLFLAIGVFAYPILRYNSNGVRKAQLVDSNFFLKFIKIVLVVQIILYIVLFPAFIKALSSSDIGEYRNETYDQAEVIKYPFYILNLLHRLYMGMRNIVILIACYALLFEQKCRKLIKIFFATSFLFPLYVFTIYMSRAVMIMQFCFSVFIFIALLSFITYKQRKKIVLWFSIMAFPVISIFIIISNSRFGNLASYMFYRYLGEAFNNYNTEFYYDLKGHTWGKAYFNLFRKLMGENIAFTTTNEKWSYLDNITGVDTHVFYTFIGGLNIEFGFVLTVIIGVMLSWIIMKKIKPFDTLTLPKLIILGMLAYTLINGAFMLIVQGDWGNLELLFALFFYFLFKKHSINKYVNSKY